MSGEVEMNGKNGKFVLPLSLLIFILLETGAGLWLLSKLSTQIEVIQTQNTSREILDMQRKKELDDKIELYRLEVHRLQLDFAKIQTVSNRR